LVVRNPKGGANPRPFITQSGGGSSLHVRSRSCRAFAWTIFWLIRQ
jgi:hypothetical protein